ncbi:hypothetical protein NX059_011106 [Plenodomus lindquistii]|nr:hypothetical protein NX059_011106 [Plenodomus lindquistii]
MFATTSTTIDSVTFLLSLSKTIWNLGLSLSNLSQHVAFKDAIISDLATEAKALSVACDFIYTRLKELVDKNSPLPPHDDNLKEIWDCFTSQIEVIGDTVVELEHFVKSDGRLDSQSAHRLQHLNRPSTQRDSVLALRVKISRQTDDLTMSLLLLNSVTVSASRHRDPRQTSDELQRLQDMVQKLEMTINGSPQSRISRIEAKLVRCAHDTTSKASSTIAYTANTDLIGKGSDEMDKAAHSEIWLDALDILNSDRQDSGRPTTATMTSPRVSVYGKHTMMTSPRTSTTNESEALNMDSNHADDDFNADLAKAALATGTEAFNAQVWEEADALLQEALRALLHLSSEQRTFSNIFSLHYKLAVCGYYIRSPREAEQGLASLARLTPSTDEHRLHIYHTMHLLAQLNMRKNQFELARTQCEKALQGRRRVAGKNSTVAMESVALMAHIYVLLDNRARAKSCLAMIPESQRDAILETVEASLGGIVEHLEFSSLLTQITDDAISVTLREHRRLSSVSNESSSTTRALPTRLLASPLGIQRQDGSHQPSENNKSPPKPGQGQTVTTLSSPKSPQSSLLHQAMLEDDPPVWATPIIPPDGDYEQDPTENRTNQPTSETVVPKQGLSRQEILQRIGCQPRDKIEEAICASDHPTLVALLKRRKSFWRSSMRKRGRSERVTALHFAALFGEVHMAELLVEAKYDVNEVPFGYSTSLTPLHFAIGARQMPMVELLLTNGAKPCEGETWTSLAKQLLSRAWMTKTMSETEKDDVPRQILAIFRLLIQYGWNINESSSTNNDTILHQAVAFWTGSYTWDMSLRTTITAFLCGKGADCRKSNAEGKTPYDIALASGQQDLIEVLRASTVRKELEGSPQSPIELPGEILDGKIRELNSPVLANAMVPEKLGSLRR